MRREMTTGLIAAFAEPTSACHDQRQAFLRVFHRGAQTGDRSGALII
jgi:hypothetical protein